MLLFRTFLFDSKGKLYAEEEAWLIESCRNVGTTVEHHHPPRAQSPVEWAIKAEPLPSTSALSKSSTSVFF